MSEPIVIPSVHPIRRVAGVLACGASGALFAALALTQHGRGHELGFALAAPCAWAALYWLCLPPERVVLDDLGFTYFDDRLDWLLVFPRARAAWRDVVGIDTRWCYGRHGHSMRTRVHVRDGARLRRFTVTSRQPGHGALLAALAAHAAQRGESGATVGEPGAASAAAGAAAGTPGVRRRPAVSWAIALLGLLLLLALLHH